MNAIIDIATLAGLTERAVVHNGERKAVTLRREYPFAIDDVWSAWTEPERAARWLGEIRGERRQGSTLELCMSPPDSDIATITVLACEAPIRLAVKWEWPGERDSYVDLQLESIDESRCALTLHHVAMTDDIVVSYGAGWEDFLARVGLLLDGQNPHDLIWDSVEPTIKPLWLAAVDANAVDECWPVIADRADDALLRAVRWFPQPITTVWKALTTPASVESWFGQLSGNPSLGGTFVVSFEGGSASGIVRECQEPSHLHMTWTWTHQDFDTAVTVDLEPERDGTRVTVQQTGVIGPAIGYAAGWAAYLRAAERYLTGRPRSEEGWQADWEIAQAMTKRQQSWT